MDERAWVREVEKKRGREEGRKRGREEERKRGWENERMRGGDEERRRREVDSKTMKKTIFLCKEGGRGQNTSNNL